MPALPPGCRVSEESSGPPSSLPGSLPGPDELGHTRGRGVPDVARPAAAGRVRRSCGAYLRTSHQLPCPRDPPVREGEAMRPHLCDLQLISLELLRLLLHGLTTGRVYTRAEALHRSAPWSRAHRMSEACLLDACSCASLSPAAFSLQRFIAQRPLCRRGFGPTCREGMRSARAGAHTSLTMSKWPGARVQRAEMHSRKRGSQRS